MRSRPARVATVLAATVVTVLAAGVGTASAHVRVSSSDAAPGGFGELTFRVPNESDTASTTVLRVQIPSETPLASVATKPVPGWTATTTTGPIDPPVDVHGTPVSEAVTEITWTADPGAGIAPGEYQTFSISGGPFPEAESISFPAVQVYDDGTEQAWIEPTVEGQEEPESPAPVLTLAESGSTDAHGAATETPEATEVATASETSADAGSSGWTITAVVLGAAGLVAGLAGLALGLAARRQRTTV
ncbi:YcnI family copper-binding membrane protein [Geodermatophilus sp. SYSU D01105]